MIETIGLIGLIGWAVGVVASLAASIIGLKAMYGWYGHDKFLERERMLEEAKIKYGELRHF